MVEEAVAFVLVGVFGAVGAMLRHGVNLGAGATLGPGFPWGTLLANAVGSFALGMVAELGEGRTILGVDARVPLGVGLLGGFTTYSSFNLEVLRLWEQGLAVRALGYAFATFGVCLVCGAIGLSLARTLRTP